MRAAGSQDCLPLLTLSSVHINLARELERLHLETIALQAAISPDLARQKSKSAALLGLQALDTHAQILADLSRIALALAQGGARGEIDQLILSETVVLASTAKTIFDPPRSSVRTTNPSGDVTLF